MQLRGVDQVEAFLTHICEAWKNFAFEWFHACRVSLVAGEVEVEMFAQQAFRRSGKTGQRILDDVAKQTLAEFAVINRRAQTEFGVQALAVAFPEFHIVFPAGKEKLHCSSVMSIILALSFFC